MLYVVIISYNGEELNMSADATNPRPAILMAYLNRQRKYSIIGAKMGILRALPTAPKVGQFFVAKGMDSRTLRRAIKRGAWVFPGPTFCIR